MEINVRPHKRLLAWKKSVEFVIRIYNVTKRFPKEEEFGLKSQLRRASVSVPSNIAEGLTRKSKNNKLHFLNMAQASLSEIDTQIEICFRLKYIDDESYESIEADLVGIQKLISGLSRKIRD